MRASILVSTMSLLAWGAPTWGQEADGDRAWARRAEGFTESGQPAAAAREALVAYESALEANPDDYRVLFKLIEALYFEAYFVTPDDRAHQRKTWNRIVRFTEEVIGHASEGGPAAERAGSYLREAYFWNAVGWGLFGMSHSRFVSAARGVAGKIRDGAEHLIEIDPDFQNAGGLRLLGRLHTATPRVPAFTSWIDRQRGIELLEQACEISTQDPRNQLFLAEALLRFSPDEEERAVGLLRQLSVRQPAADHLVEESETLTQARRLLGEVEE